MLMKDGLGADAISRIAEAISLTGYSLDKNAFFDKALDGLDELELKERVHHLIEVLHQFLPAKFSDASKVLKALPAVWPVGNPDDPTNGFAAWPVTDYVAVYGSGAPKTALTVLEKLTCLFSAEFAIRPFILNDTELTFKYLNQWLEHPDDHVRRLVSEGTRPRLPWGMQLKPFIDDPSPTVPLLAALRLDKSEYVRRSVANHLNDISKDHPDLVIDVCKKWQALDKGKSDWVIRHGTRSLVKAGHPGVFTLLGFTDASGLKIQSFSLDKSNVCVGEALDFSAEIMAKKKSKCVVDYVVYFMKANGAQASKVFKLKNIELTKGETIKISKSISFKKITTRKYYAGEHKVALQINGRELKQLCFNLHDVK